MANEIKEIGEIVKKCKILLLDIEGTTTSISFVKDKLFPYAEENVKQFLDSRWETDDVKEAVTALRKLAIEDKDNSVEGVVPIPGEDSTKEEQIEGLVNNVKWQMSSDRKVGPLKHLQGLIWKQGYDNGDIKGHVYDDVSPALELWRSSDGQKVYIYSSGSVAAQKLLFGQSLAGDLLPLIDGHFDTAVGAKQEAASYTKIVEKIGCKPDDILFLTDILKEAEAARESGLQVALVQRAGNAPLPEESSSYPVLQSLQQLNVAKKRKPDTQEEQPSKVAKTDVDSDVKKTTESESEVETKLSESPSSETKDQMEVEELPDITTKEELNEPTPMETANTTTLVEEITVEEAKVEELPAVNIEPVITEDETLKTDKKETVEMETESAEISKNSETKETSKLENGDEPVNPSTITEIEDISDKQDLTDVGEIIDGIEPVIEEPPADDEMEVLQNVGEVLEKECDEILSKVQDVTNLDNIPIKPLLNTIAEETIDADENIDSNDIVDRILDTELELEMKQASQMELNTVQESKETKTEEEHTMTEAKAITNEPEDKSLNVTETKTEVGGNVESSPKEETEKKIEESNSVETKAQPKTESSEKEEKKEEEVESKDVPVLEENIEAVKAEETVSEEVKDTKDTKEPLVNGKATNGDAGVVNGDANKDLNSRLTVEENGKEIVNGSNGDSKEVTPAAHPDIKVKSVASDEPRTDPIEQPTEV